MRKSVKAFIITIVCGYFGTVFGDEFLNWPQLGPILAVAVMGVAILSSLEDEDE